MEDKYKNLKKRKIGTRSNGQIWSIDNIKDGLEYFKDLHGSYPTSREVDVFDYLPSSRSIQRSYGGMVNIRKQLNLSGPLDFTKGEVRSAKAQEADKRAKLYEEEFFYFLLTKVEEMRVHEHKIIRPGNVASDFFIYTSQNKGVVIDLFYAADIINLSKIINIKYKKYIKVIYPIFFIVVGNDSISQSSIDKIISNKTYILPKSMRVLNEKTFKSNFDNFIRIKS